MTLLTSILHFNRRGFLPLLILATTAVCSALAQEVVLQDDKVLVAFSAKTGALTRLINKTTNWTIERRPELGVSFRMIVPLPDREYNPVLGQKQKAKVTKVSDHQVAIEWRNLVSEHGGTLPITLASTVTLSDGRLKFEASLVNDSRYTVETIDYPYFGDFCSPDPSTKMVARTMWYANLGATEIYPTFRNEKGYWGDLYPLKTFDSNRSLFCLIQTPREGVYVEMEDATQPYLLQYTFEQRPGVLTPATNVVPPGDEIGGIPVHLEFRTCHFAFIHSGSEKKLAPVVVRFYEGDWHAGVDLFKEWRTTWFHQSRIPEWVKGVHSWQQVQLNTPVQDYRISYTDLVKYGEDCAKNGVAAIQVVGWNLGGQDGGNPSLSTDPGLGTWQQLHDAIDRIQATGVKVVLFGKFPWADKTTEWYKNELYRYETVDPYGVPYEATGYAYETPTQLAGITNHRFAVMDFLDPAYREIATREFRKVLALGAAGFLYDEVPTHDPAKYNFATGHGYTPPGYLYAGDIPLARQLHAAADSVSRDFLFSGEGPQDWLLQYYPLSYIRVNQASTPVCRYIDSRAPLMVAVIGFDNREMLNLCLLNRYIISYEPYNFKGRLSDFPLTLEYGKKIDALRKKYETYLWDADFQDTKGATVTVDGISRYPVFETANEPGQGGGWRPVDGAYKYSVFVTSTGKRAVVIVNMGPTKSVTANIVIPRAGALVVATPENPEAVTTTGMVQVAARSAAVVMEQ